MAIASPDCSCGARAFYAAQADEHKRLTKKVQPMGGSVPVSMSMGVGAGAIVLRATQAQPEDKDPKDMPAPATTHNKRDDASSAPARKRSLWRKLLGKGPKCICAKLARERERKRIGLIRIPSEYVGCDTVRVAGKRVAYTREMQLIKRESYTPLEAIDEDEL